GGGGVGGGGGGGGGGVGGGGGGGGGGGRGVVQVSECRRVDDVVRQAKGFAQLSPPHLVVARADEAVEIDRGVFGHFQLAQPVDCVHSCGAGGFCPVQAQAPDHPGGEPTDR